jgi:hypothetical protein
MGVSWWQIQAEVQRRIDPSETERERTSSFNSRQSVEGIRYGAHEMKSSLTKHHYHEETWTYDPSYNVMNGDNVIVRVPLQR